MISCLPERGRLPHVHVVERAPKPLVGLPHCVQGDRLLHDRTPHRVPGRVPARRRRDARHRGLRAVHAVPVRPQRDVPQQHRQRHEQRSRLLGRLPVVHGIREAWDRLEVLPDAVRALPYRGHDLPLPLAEERPEPARVDVLRKQQEVPRTELEVVRELVHELEDAVDELEEDRRELSLVAPLLVPSLAVAATGVEGVAEREEVLLDERAEPLDRPVVRIEQELGERGDLTRPIPTVLCRRERRCDTSKCFFFRKTGNKRRAREHRGRIRYRGNGGTRRKKKLTLQCTRTGSLL